MKAGRPAETSASPERLLSAAASLHLDAVTAEVVGALRDARVDSILLRGPAIARWLYDDETSRAYVDVDLLVAHADLARAEAVVSRLGFSDLTVEGVLADDRPTHAHTWARRRDGAAVDLHYTLLGARVEADRAWAVLAGETETLAVNGTTVDILRTPGRAVVVALHAAQHGVDMRQPLDDLARALALLPDRVWDDAAVLAARLEATLAFATGLRLLPPGQRVASRLELPVDRSVETALRASTPPPTALGFDWLARTPGVNMKMRLLARKVVPDATFMRAWSPLARRGRAGLIGAYVWRLLWLARHAGPGFLAWRRARRPAR
jgi:Uncharacterised nucleotidyltransferase